MLLKFSTVAAMAFISAALTTGVNAHVSMNSPCTRYSPKAGCPAPPAGQSIDYDINSPIGTHDNQNQPICKHTVPMPTGQVLQAGSTVTTEYSVGAPHGGGNCQWALSYDGGNTWVVIKTIIRSCLADATGGSPYSIPVPIPAGAPSGKAVFMWLWNNAIGNRELYSNCADVEIAGTAGGSITGLVPAFPNYGSASPAIPEFGGGAGDAGQPIYDARKTITVTASGGGTVGAAPAPAPAPPTTGGGSTPAPAPAPAPAPGGCAGTAAWAASATYVANDKVSYQGQIYTAKWWTSGETPGTTGQWGVWSTGTAC